MDLSHYAETTCDVDNRWRNVLTIFKTSPVQVQISEVAITELGSIYSTAREFKSP